MEEKNFFNSGNVSVTNARFIVHGQTYALSGITSVKSYQHDPSRKGPVIGGIVGLLALAAGDWGVAIGLIFIACAILWWILDKKKFSVLLNTASGETEALTSHNSRFISQIVDALNEAIIYRG